jgi:hypothetical protein
MTEEACFKNGINENIFSTYKKITYIIQGFGLPLPSFWERRFPPLK